MVVPREQIDFMRGGRVCLLGSAEGRTADLATVLTVLYAGSGCAGFVPRATSTSSCIDFQTVFSWKVVLFLVHPGSPMAHLGRDITSLAADTEAVRIRASEAGVLVLRRAWVRERWVRRNSLLWGARGLSDRGSINHRSRSIRAKTASRDKRSKASFKYRH